MKLFLSIQVVIAKRHDPCRDPWHSQSLHRRPAITLMKLGALKPTWSGNMVCSWNPYIGIFKECVCMCVCVCVWGGGGGGDVTRLAMCVIFVTEVRFPGGRNRLVTCMTSPRSHSKALCQGHYSTRLCQCISIASYSGLSQHNEEQEFVRLLKRELTCVALTQTQHRGWQLTRLLHWELSSAGLVSGCNCEAAAEASEAAYRIFGD